MTPNDTADTDTADEVLHDVSDGVCRITLNRPHRKNAITREQRDRVIALLDDAAARLDVRVVVLAGSGGSFCTGADLGAQLAGPPRPDDAPARVIGEVAHGMRVNAHRFINAIMDCEKPVIAAVDGVAAGMGVHIALACDLVIASEGTVFHEVFARRGIVPDAGGPYLLGRLIGPQKTKELLFFGESLPAADAHRLGLVNKVVATDEFAAAVDDWATRLAAAPTRTIALCKSLVNRSLDLGRSEALAMEALAQDLNMVSEDANEGIQAFLEKRDPRFSGW